jgi:hypothetical protein
MAVSSLQHTQLPGLGMADKTIEPRAVVDLPVRIWGMSAEGRPFSQSARARNISSDGALLTGVEIELKVGEVIGLQCGDKKTRCAVTWVMNTGEIDKNQVGVKIVAAECPWQSYLPIDGALPVTFSSSNRRRFHRHKIALPLEIRDDRVNAPFRINASDVSANGCYIERACNRCRWEPLCAWISGSIPSTSESRPWFVLVIRALAMALSSPACPLPPSNACRLIWTLLTRR